MYTLAGPSRSLSTPPGRHKGRVMMNYELPETQNRPINLNDNNNNNNHNVHACGLPETFSVAYLFFYTRRVLGARTG